MNIILVKPPTNNWLLLADHLDDPASWDRFVPCHTTNSQRWKFECTVKEQAAATGVKVRPCKDMIKRGLSAFEYDWTTEEDNILLHAMQVAEMLGLELLMDVAAANGSSHTAA